jgi:coenzyme F420-0:L-glutamate ligase / coenzyme F420-1:gamma-L-glutamate ligase
MELLAIRTQIIGKGDDVASIIAANATIQSGDIIAITSKVIATAEGTIVDLSSLTPTAEAISYAEQTKRSPAFMQAVIDETKRLNGKIIGHCPGAVLCEVRPDGMGKGTILTANAGMDESNVEPGTAVGWPHDPVAACKELSEKLGCGVLIIDSCCVPRRNGVTAFALAVCGFDPLRSEIGKADLFGKKLSVTVEAVGDQLATMSAMIMGNAAQSIPATIIRGHGIPESDYCGFTEGIEPEEDLFRAII